MVETAPTQTESIPDTKPEQADLTTKSEPETKDVKQESVTKPVVDVKEEDKKPLAETKPPVVETPVDVPDPDEDDLDDLDGPYHTLINTYLYYSETLILTQYHRHA